MASVLELGDLRIDVVRRDIKNLHLSVHPPTGGIRLAAPLRLGEAALRAFVIGQLSWIRRQRGKLQAQERETPREYLERESHYVWGQRCLLRLVEHDAPPAIDWQPR
jgi:predicted metal-dependent hydrolase